MMTSLKLSRSSGSGNTVWHVFGRLSSFKSFVTRNRAGDNRRWEDEALPDVSSSFFCCLSENSLIIAIRDRLNEHSNCACAIWLVCVGAAVCYKQLKLSFWWGQCSYLLVLGFDWDRSNTPASIGRPICQTYYSSQLTIFLPYCSLKNSIHGLDYPGSFMHVDTKAEAERTLQEITAV